jgi:hypothetical protein
MSALDGVLLIDQIGGNCPVQAEGTIDGVPFYFRARGEHWSIGVGGDDPVCAPEWEREEEWGDGPFAAVWMPLDEARRIIERCAGEYRKWQNSNSQPPQSPLSTTSTNSTETTKSV